MSGDWLTDERVGELLREAKAKGAEFDPLLLAALMEIRQRRSWGSTAAPPARKAQFSEATLAWAKGALEFAIQNLYDDPYGYVGDGDRDQDRELAALEAWEELEAVAAELGAETVAEVAARCATQYERDRMEKLLARGRWAKSRAAGEAVETEEQEAL